jgi:DNA-binding response OmpR family regulator
MMTGIRVLLIEDDPAESKALARYLRLEAEFEVASFADRREALEHLRTARHDYTAILLDYVLKAEEMSGRQVLLAIREQHPQSQKRAYGHCLKEPTVICKSPWIASSW